MPRYNSASPIFYPVHIEPLHGLLNSDHICENMQAVVAEDTGEVIAVHKQNYRLHKNKDILTQFEETLMGSSLDRNNLEVSDALTPGRGRMIRTYTFPNHKVDIDGEGDLVALQLRVVNSYDGSASFSVMLGAYRYVCSNGLVVGDNYLNHIHKHTGGLNIVSVADQLSSTASAFMENADTWRVWHNTPCPVTIANNIFESMQVSDRVKTNMKEQYGARTNGPLTLWTVYNTMTRWSSHGEVKPSALQNKPTITIRREGKVKQALEHPIFNIAA